MSIPVVEIEHKKVCGQYRRFDNICAPDCPACAVEANNKAWAKYLVEKHCPTRDDGYWQHRAVYIPASDWEQIKKLAEEKVDG